MIYLKPLGGLCNRMRTIDSLITICKAKQEDMTVLWVKDNSLNCSFGDLFLVPEFKEFNFKIIDCPIGFPENYMSKFKEYDSNSGTYHLRNASSTRYIKNILKGRFISSEQKKICKNIEGIDDFNILTNEELAVLYASNNHLDSLTAREMDVNFFVKVEKRLKEFLDSESVFRYITSCYRMVPRENNYRYFQPISSIEREADITAGKFNRTYGLHIRRTDHTTSKNYSTTDRFLEIVKNVINKEKDASFFLSTDDDETKQALISEFGEIIISNKVSSYDRNHPDAVKDALVDLICLSKTRKIYGSHHSSFSQTAADIGEIEEITAK
ncbi:MAG: hypothetical protein V7724_02140 [Sediminicola sp.]